MFHNRSILPLIALLSLTQAGCQFFNQSPNTQAPAAAPNQSPVKQPPTNPLPPAQSYELQFNKGEVWGLVRKITFTDNSIVVTAEITNGSRQVIELNAKDDMYLNDNLYNKNRYNLSAPTNNPTIQIQPGSTVKGDFVFIGRLAPKATELTLYTNATNYSGINANRPYIAVADIFIRR